MIKHQTHGVLGKGKKTITQSSIEFFCGQNHFSKSNNSVYALVEVKHFVHKRRYEAQFWLKWTAISYAFSKTGNNSFRGNFLQSDGTIVDPSTHV